MTIINKERYRSLCKKQFIPLFSQAWWLDATCGKGGWDVFLCELGGQIVASLPYAFKKKYGFVVMGQPLLTQALGIWINYPVNQKEPARLAWEKKVMSCIIEQIISAAPKVFVQNFSHCVTNWLPFYWAGFSQTTRYTYILKDLANIDSVWENMESRVRSDIRKAESQLCVSNDITLDTFYQIIGKTFERQSLTCPYSLSFLDQVDFACKQQKNSCIYAAMDSDNNIYASVYVAWDSKTTYYLMGGTDYNLYRSPNMASLGRGALALCLWRAIGDAQIRGQQFDFEGSMIEGVEKFFRSFGATQTPYYQISRRHSFMELVLSLRKFFSF